MLQGIRSRPKIWIPAGAVAVVLGVGIAINLGFVDPSELSLAANTPVAARSALELDGTVVGWLDAAEGGEVASVARPGIIALETYGDISLRFGSGMSSKLYSWLADALNEHPQYKNGAIIRVNSRNQEISRMTFNDALVTEVDLPAVDASSRDPARMAIKISPQTTRTTATPGGGRTVGLSYTSPPPRWMPANFRLSIGGTAPADSFVQTIDALVVKIKHTRAAFGGSLEAGPITLPNLTLTLPESRATAFATWHEAVPGTASAKRAGVLEYYGPNPPPANPVDPGVSADRPLELILLSLQFRDLTSPTITLSTVPGQTQSETVHLTIGALTPEFERIAGF